LLDFSYLFRNGFFCLIIDTLSVRKIWEDIFGHGKIESEVLNINAIDLLDESLRKYIFEENLCNEESICDKKIDVILVDEFNSHERSSIKSILDTW